MDWKQIKDIIKRETLGWVVALLILGMLLTAIVDVVQVAYLIRHENAIEALEQGYAAHEARESAK